MAYRLLIMTVLLALLLTFSACDGDTDPISDHADGDAPSDGDSPDGDTPDGDTPDGDEPDGDMPEDGDSPTIGDGDEPTDGDSPADGDTPDGDMPDGDTPDGDTADGDVENPTDGDDPDGDDPDPNDPPIDLQRLIREADIYQLRDDLLVLLNPHLGLVRVDVASPAQASITGRLAMLEKPHSMYLQNTLAVLMAEWEGGTLEEGRLVSQVSVVDVTPGQNVELLDEIQVDGHIVESRWVGSNLYLVLAEAAYTDSISGEEHPARMRIRSFELGVTGLVAIDSVAIPGEALAVYVNSSLIAISTPGSDGSLVHLVDIRDIDGEIDWAATMYASGEVRDRYKMDADGNIFTIVSHSPFGGGQTFVETFDISTMSNPAGRGFVALAPGEELHATMFRDDMLYIVTYLRPEIVEEIEDEEIVEECRNGCDPLWTVDLSDPSDPQVLGELIIPGWSEHMIFRDSKLYAVGYSDQWETKVAIFDVADPTEPREMTSLVVPGQVETSDPDELYDFKSFTILWNRGLMLVPVHGVAGNVTAFVSFSVQQNAATLEHVASIPSLEAARRSFLMDDYLGILADSQLDVLDIANPRNPQVVNSLMFVR